MEVKPFNARNKETTSKLSLFRSCVGLEIDVFFLQKRDELGLLLYLHVRTVGIREVNIRKRSEKNKQPVLLKTLLPSFPMP